MFRNISKQLSEIREQVVYFNFFADDVPTKARIDAVRDLAQRRHDLLGRFQAIEKATSNFTQRPP